MAHRILYSYFPIIALILYAISDLLHINLFVAVGALLVVPYIIKYIIGGPFYELRMFMYIVFVASILNLLTTDNGIGGSIIFIGSCGITAYCLNNLRKVQFIVLIVGFFLLWYLYKQIFINNVRVDDIFEAYGVSKNYPGCLLVIITCFWGTCKYMHYRVLPFLFPILSVIMAFFLDGRASLICIAVILIFCVAFRYKKHLSISIFLTVGIIFYFWNDILVYYELSSLSSKGVDTLRYQLWESYFSNLDFTSLMFGLETKNLPYLRDFGGNPHNSLLNFHYRMGLLGVSCLIFYIIKGWWKLVKSNEYVILFFSVVLFVRNFTDTNLVAATDFITFTLIFYPYYSKRINSISVLNEKTNNRKSIIKLINKISKNIVSVI